MIMLMADIIMLAVALIVAFSMRLGEWYWPEGDVVWLIMGAPVMALPIFIRFGLYRAIVRYIGFKALWVIAQAVSLYALIWGVIVLLTGVDGVPRSVILINWFVVMLLVGGSRMVARWWIAGTLYPAGAGAGKNVVIYGAGDAGIQLATALSYSRELRPIAFIDDAPSLLRQQIGGLIVHSFGDLSTLIEKRGAVEVLLALPSVSRARRSEIITMLEPYPLLVRTLPGVTDIAQGTVKVDDLREVSIEDLLGREAVPPNQQLLHSNITGKTVMVTGAGGSIGSELCRQIASLEPNKIVLFEQSEVALYDMEQELKGRGCRCEIVPILGDIKNQSYVEHVCNHFGIETIYHSAAFKHVPMVELNTVEGVRNNVFGTLSAARAAIASGVETFVLISTDKAVRPTNTMGTTKRMAEMVLQALSAKLSLESGGTRFVMVRFGNVLGSSGSVIPLFRRQIEAGGPVTVTDSKIIRYFMTIPEAAQLVLQAGAMGEGGDVFVLDMGEPIRILDLARKMIHLSGLQVKNSDHPDGDIEIEFTGLRPGEKLFEELLIGDNVLPTDHPMIMRAEEEMIPWDELKVSLENLEAAVDGYDYKRIRQVLEEMVPEFSPQCEIMDLLYNSTGVSDQA